VYLAFTHLKSLLASCLCHIEGFFLELLLRMPTLSWGIQWSACLVWPPLCDVGSLAPTPLLYEGLLPGASFAHAHFISGHSVEYLSIWPPL